MKKLIVFFIAIAIITSGVLFAQGAAETESTKTGETVINLTHTNWRPEDYDAWTRIYGMFENDEPGITIESTPRPTERYFSSVEIDGEGKVLDDMLNLWQNRVWNNSMFNKGYILDLTDKIDNISKMPDHHKYNFSNDDGKIFALPIASQYTGILYNKKIFAENGIEIPKTWEEFIQVCDKLQAAKITPLAFQGKDAWCIHYAFDLMLKPYLGGPEFLQSLKNHTYDFTNPDFIAALEKFKTLSKYFPENYMGLGYNDEQNMTAVGQVAMWPGAGSWEVMTLKGINPDIELGVFPTPVDPGMKSYVTVFTDTGISVSAFSTFEEQNACLKFINWIGSPEKAKIINAELGFFGAWDNDSFEDEALQEYAALAGENGENIVSDWAILLSDSSPTATDLIQVGLQDLLSEKKTATEVATDIKKGLSVWY